MSKILKYALSAYVLTVWIIGRHTCNQGIIQDIAIHIQTETIQVATAVEVTAKAGQYTP